MGGALLHFLASLRRIPPVLVQRAWLHENSEFGVTGTCRCLLWRYSHASMRLQGPGLTSQVSCVHARICLLSMQPELCSQPLTLSLPCAGPAVRGATQLRALLVNLNRTMLVDLDLITSLPALRKLVMSMSDEFGVRGLDDAALSLARRAMPLLQQLAVNFGSTRPPLPYLRSQAADLGLN